MPLNVYMYDKPSKSWRQKGSNPIYIGSGNTADPLYDWSDSNLPWRYSSTNQFTEGWPTTPTVVDIQTSSNDFFTNLTNTVNAAGGRCVVRLGEGVYNLTSFPMYGSSGNPLYAFGFFLPNLQGFLGQGPDKTFVQMDANSLSQAQLDRMAQLDPQTFEPAQLGICRFDGSAASPVYLAGLTFRAADQQMLTAKHSNLNIVVPQPAPHNGVVLYQNAHAYVSYVRFQGAGRAASSAPPFECANVGSQYGSIYFRHCEFDGRRSPDLDPAQPRRCGVIMGNNETEHVLEDCWLHHSNVSRYAVNDENRNTQGQYTVRRTKVEQITNTQNRDPALNSGNSLGGYTNATPLGWESCNGTITVEDCIISQDNNQSSGQVPMHLQLTSVGARNPQGGRLYVRGGTFFNTGWSQLDGFVGFRIATATYWWQDGFDTTLFVYHKDGQRLSPYQVTGGWPPSAATLAANGVTPQTHYIIRGA